MGCATLPLKPSICCRVGILPAQTGRARRPSHKNLDQVAHRVQVLSYTEDPAFLDVHPYGAGEL